METENENAIYLTYRKQTMLKNGPFNDLLKFIVTTTSQVIKEIFYSFESQDNKVRSEGGKEKEKGGKMGKKEKVFITNFNVIQMKLTFLLIFKLLFLLSSSLFAFQFFQFFIRQVS